MSELHPNGELPAPPFFARTIRRFSIPIILAWLAIIAVLTIGVPSLEQVEKEHSVSLTPEDAPSVKAMKRMGDDFKESASDAVLVAAERTTTSGQFDASPLRATPPGAFLGVAVDQWAPGF